MAEVVELFARDAPRRLGVLREAVRRGDTAVLEQTAHALKGSAAHVGARVLTAVCARLEEVALGGAPADVEELLDAAEGELGRVTAALADEIAGREP